MFSELIPDDGPPDMQGICRFAVARAAAARRQGRAHHARLYARLVRQCLRALRFAARMTAGTLRRDPACSHPLFSDLPEKVREAPASTSTAHPDRRHTFREGRRRR